MPSCPQAGLQGRPPPSAYRKSLGPVRTTFSDSSQPPLFTLGPARQQRLERCAAV